VAIDHVLAVIPVADTDVASRWYERLFGGLADNRPMPNLAEWRVTGTGWVQVFVDAGRAGSTLVNLAGQVDELAGQVDELRGRGLEPQPIQSADKGGEQSSLVDPDGNLIALIGDFRIEY